MRNCKYCGKPELCGIGKENIPICEKHYEDYLSGKRLEIKKAINLINRNKNKQGDKL